MKQAGLSDKSATGTAAYPAMGRGSFAALEPVHMPPGVLLRYMGSQRRSIYMKSRDIDMLHGSLTDKLIAFTVPLALSSILQQLFNSADLAVVGRFDSSAAMAAVGSNAALINLIVSLFTGLAVGANVVVAALIGRGRLEKISAAVHTIITVAVISGFLLTGVGELIAPAVLRMVGTPDDVLPLAEVYLRIYFSGMVFFLVYNFGAAILRAKGDSKRPLYALIASGVLNVVLNLIFVIVFGLGVAGVAIATVLSNGLSAGMVLVFLMREEETYRYHPGRVTLDKRCLRDIIAVGAPAGIQGMVFSLSNVVIQAGINSFGSACIAGNTAAQNYEYMAYFVVNAFAQTAVTFTSQNFAAGNARRCRQIYLRTELLALVCTAVVSGIFLIFRYPLIHIFTDDPDVVSYAMVRMYWIMSIELLTSSYEISGGCLRGMQHSMLPALETVLGCCVFRLFWVSTVFRHHHDIVILMSVYIITWGITAAMVLPSYFIIRRKEFAKL